VLNAEGHDAGGPWMLARLESAASSGAVSTAQVTLRHADGREIITSGSGDGPVDAAYKAVEDATQIVVQVTKYEVRALTVGEDAQGETVVYVTHGERSYRGASISTNIVEASVNALLEVINRIELAQRNARPALRDAERLAKTAV
jgi:2-isopropylmalate synthase